VDVQAVYERLVAAVADDGLSEDAGVAVSARYTPGVPGAKIFPPTFVAPRKGEPIPPNWPYVREQRRIDGVPRDVVVVDTVASQANRVEAALERVASAAGLPVVELTATVADGQVARVTSWSAPHRHADAYFEHATLDGTAYWSTAEGKAVLSATPDNAAALLAWYPGSLVFGSWTSRKKGRQSRFPRLYTSEMVGLDPLIGERAGVRNDPLNLQLAPKTTIGGTNDKAKIGLGMVPAGRQPGGASVSEVRRWGWLSFAGLRGLRFGPDAHADAAARALLAALALWGDRLAFGTPALWLRSGCDLVVLEETLTWTRHGGEADPLELDAASARTLFDAARTQAADLGVEMPAAVRTLEPDTDLRRAIEFTLTRAEGGAGE